MVKVALMVGALVIVSMVAGCAEFHDGYRYDSYYDSSSGGHAHH